MILQLRQQLASFWGHQSKIQRIVLITLVCAAMVLIPLFVIWANTPTYTVAFSGLSEEDAGLIVEKLQADNIPYQLRSSNTILVPSGQVYDVRLKMAREGLPQGGTVGFELFNSNTLGMTEFTQRVNYQRALEGELERTIGSMSVIQAVRVHIVIPEKTLLADAQAPTTASVTVQEKPGQHLDASQVRSITHLIASSVEAMKPENVVVVDVNGNLLATGESSDQSVTMSQTDDRRATEQMAAREVQKKVQELLDSVLGPNKSVVQASVTLDWSERETTTQSFDPLTSAIRSSQTVSEVYTTTNGTLAGIPGAGSNLPPADTGTYTGDQAINYQRNENTTNYEITQVQKHEVMAPGQVSRVSLSVLVDGVTDQKQIEALRSAIAAAAGIDTARGDMLAVETLAFDRTYYKTQATDLENSQKQDLYIRIGEAVIGVLLLAALLWYIQRLLTNLRLASAEAWTPILKPVSELGLSYAQPLPASTSQTSLPMSIEEKIAIVEKTIHPLSNEKATAENYLLPKAEAPVGSVEEEQLRQYVAQLVEKDPAGLAEILQLWLNEDEKNNV